MAIKEQQKPNKGPQQQPSKGPQQPQQKNPQQRPEERGQKNSGGCCGSDSKGNQWKDNANKGFKK